MATITDTTTDANGNIIINVSSSVDDAITLATAGTYSDKNIIFNIKTPQNSVQPDWNQNDDTQPDYVKNRPFYTGDQVENIFVEESTVSFADTGDGYYGGQIQSTFVPTIGETYKVSWDGADYECTCIETNGIPLLGDFNIVFGMHDPADEPFLIDARDGKKLGIITVDSSASHTFSIVSRESVAPVVKINPKYLPISFKPSGGSYLIFSSANSFTLSVKNLSKNWDGTLEYFTSDGAWTIWDGTKALVANANEGEYALYLRGTENTVITGNNGGSWYFNGTDIKCIGNIENLLDYATVASGAHPNMSDHCYANMFEGCASLTQAPELPATTLAEYCYSFMFNGCTNLTQAPALPATTLADNCYARMFQDCTNLTRAPELPATTLAVHCYSFMFDRCTNLTRSPALPATTLAAYCYYCMFRDCTNLTQAPALPATTLAAYCYSSIFERCTNLKLSSTKTDEYTQEYRIPFSGNGTTASNALRDIFASTGGTFTGTPSINTTYYLSSDNMVVRETEIATLNGYVDSMIDAAVPKLDTTLSITGKSADAKATGDAIRALSEEIITTSESKVAAHNTGTDTHSDIRLLIQGLTDRLNALADSDDTTLDQLSEVVAYIKSNRSLIEAITTNKVSVADIVDNLTTNVSNKPLSAAQGVVIKTLIDALRNDKLDAAELTNAVNTALAQAKASGEFDGQDGKTAYQYAQDGGYTGTEAEFTAKLAQEQLTGATNELTPTQVYEAVSAGIPVKVQYTDSTYGLLSFTAFNVAESLNVIVSQTIVYYNGLYILCELYGDKSSNAWGFKITTLAQKTDIPSELPNPSALTFTGAVTGSYDGSAPLSVKIPSAVTDDHINSLIDVKLGVIENGSY